MAVAVVTGAAWADPRLAAPVLAYGTWIALQFWLGPRAINRLHRWRGATAAEAFEAELAFRKRLADRIEAIVTVS